MGIAARISRRRSMVVFIVLIGIVAVWLTQRPVGAQTNELVFWTVGGTGGKATFVNVNQPGLRIGDRLAARGPLLDASRTSEVGRHYLDCVIMNRITVDPVEEPHGLYWCTYLLKLDGGDLTISGLDPRGPSVGAFAVLGGTGAYAGASGEATLTDTDEGTEFVIDLG
jgi:hypothetical protein